MSSVDFFLADQNWPFLAAAVATLAIAVLEVVSLLLGLGLAQALDNLMPDFDVDIDADLDADLDAGGLETGSSGAIAQAFGWLNVGRVPVLILLVCFLALFALAGFAGQLLAKSVLGLLPALLMTPAALAIALPTTRVASRLFSANIVPREETYAVGDAELVGRLAEVTLGPVGRKQPGKAKVTDEHGNLHFVRLRSGRPGVTHEVGDEVLLVSVEAAVFEAIKPTANLIVEEPNNS